MRTHTIRRAAAVAITLTLATSLAACGGDESGHDSHRGTASDVSTASNGDVFNDADIEFATHMIQHHAQAVQMVVMTQGRPLDPEVEQLAQDIRAAQVPEIETMTDWLTAWDQEIPETSMDHVNMGHSMGDMSGSMEGMEGMDDMLGAMTAEDMDALENASDADFQDMWLAMMVEHHQGAVDMAQTEQDDGANTDATTLATTIIETQQVEIDTMEGLLG
ncbi:DUF305 domain-containing protein [Nocardioides lianchengensis]|uniref:Uncharacterized conserved protein, DUF305 family n=1 Tax=Nocardioides lianchengensis TaxID=1045774 RepID=A0A1G6URI9_9ACTN|nr:DUF305 domain-containing protein [Nocardioides lianchengensis]NYG11015.1 uncharacterized protein (DUF305 family) [Nocardioides lianchengensis]SDD43911.1 Uncharacterized conserved protein, DUF305 family [Nocardioides lianchengensis]